MSLRQEANELRQVMLLLRQRGRVLKREGASMEQAMHFQEVTNAYLYAVGVSTDKPSMESAEVPEAVVNATLEGIGDVLKGLMNILSRKPKEGGEKNKAAAKVDNWQEIARKMKDGFTNKAWLDSAEFVEGPITLPAEVSNYFRRDNTEFTDFQSLAREIAKDFNEYQSIYKTTKSSTVPYLTWAAQTWKVVEDYYKAHYKQSMGEEEEEAFYAQVIALMRSQLTKRPEPPILKTTISTHARLGYPSPDTWIKPPRHKGNDPEWDIKTYHPKSKGVTVTALSRHDMDAATALYTKLYDFVLAAEKYNEECRTKYYVDGFDDYPYRDGVILDVMEEKFDNFGSEIFTYDAHYLYATITGPLSAIPERCGLIADALYSWMRHSVKTQP